MPVLPSLFISHGPPDILLKQQASLACLRELGERFPQPRSILIVSAHWIADPVGVTADKNLPTIHDFGGFPSELYRIQYPALGDPELTDRVLEALAARGVSHTPVSGRGLDHGAWVPLSLIYPDARVPVVQVSLPSGSLANVAELGKALAPLRDDGVLVIGSGGSVHNLRALKRDAHPDDWARAFEDWLHESVKQGRFERLLDPQSHTQHFHKAHPTLDHFAPLVVAWAAAGAAQSGRRIHHSFDYGNLGMSFFEFAEEAK